jgi:glycerol-3-phosphate dehydrogenase subunit B
MKHTVNEFKLGRLPFQVPNLLIVTKLLIFILASGRFLGKGLHADRKHIHETIFDLPVTQPPDRTLWHRKDFLDSRGHPINRAGLEIDDSFRPLDSSGHPAFKLLFAAGSILAHQDWMRMKCGSGLALATGFAAVQSFVRLFK